MTMWQCREEVSLTNSHRVTVLSRKAPMQQTTIRNLKCKNSVRLLMKLRCLANCSSITLDSRLKTPFPRRLPQITSNQEGQTKAIRIRLRLDCSKDHLVEVAHFCRRPEVKIHPSVKAMTIVDSQCKELMVGGSTLQPHLDKIGLSRGALVSLA